MAFPPGFLDELRARLSLSEVVGRKVSLKRRSGAEYAGLCPFHNEKTPSFTVNDKKGFFYCFGCHEKGDAVGFVMKTEGLSFPEAVEKLAREVNLPVPRATPVERERAERVSTLAAGRRRGRALVPEAAAPAGRPPGPGLPARPRPRGRDHRRFPPGLRAGFARRRCCRTSSARTCRSTRSSRRGSPSSPRTATASPTIASAAA